MNGYYVFRPLIWFILSRSDLKIFLDDIKCELPYTFNHLQSMILIWFFELIKTPSFSCFKINLRFINNKYQSRGWGKLCRYLNGVFLAKTSLVVKACIFIFQNRSSWFISSFLKKCAWLYRFWTHNLSWVINSVCRFKSQPY